MRLIYSRNSYHGARAGLFALAAACRARGQYHDARLILADLRDERIRNPHRHRA